MDPWPMARCLKHVALFLSGRGCPHGSNWGTFLGSHADCTTLASMPVCCFSWVASPSLDLLVMSLAVNSSKGRPCFSPALLSLSLSACYKAGTQYLPGTGRHSLISYCSNTSHFNVPGSLSPELDLLKWPYWWLHSRRDMRDKGCEKPRLIGIPD